jgi:hypothetical protein
MATQAKTTPKNLTPIPPTEVDPPKPLTLTEALIDVIDRYASDKNLDPQLTLDATARAVHNIDHELKARLRAYEDAQRRKAFDEAFAQRKAEFNQALAESGEPYFIVKRQWVSSRRNVVAVEGFSADIFAKEVK